MDELFTTLRRVNENLYIFSETGKFGDVRSGVSDNQVMQCILDLHYNLRFLTVVTGTWMSAIVANDLDACEAPSHSGFEFFEIFINFYEFVYNFSEIWKILKS